MIEETPLKLATFSFDDGGPEDFPVLDLFSQHGAIPTIYLITTLVNAAEMIYACPTKELKERYARAEIGSHTVSHPHLSLLNPEGTRYELETSRKTLEDLLEKPVTLFAHPYGSTGEDTEEALQSAGYTWARRIHRSYDKFSRSQFAMPINCMLHSEEEESILKQRIAAGLPVHALCHSYYIGRVGWMPLLERWLKMVLDAGYTVVPNSTYFEQTFTP